MKSNLYNDVSLMLHRSSVSKLKIDQTLRLFKKQIRKHSEGALYQALSPEVKFNLCSMRILQRDFSQWDGWQFRDEWAAKMRYGIKNIPLWQGEYTESLVVIGEQGIGDEVLWASLLPECRIRVKEVTYACDERLVDIIKRSLGVNTVKRHKDAREDLLGGYTSYIPAADLFPLFRRREGDFPKKPFLKVNPERVKEFERFRGRTGISWQGRHGYINPFDLGIKNPVNLQYDGSEEGIEEPGIDLRNDIEGVYALISVLDKVVTVPTSVMHFAGSIGKRCEVILTERKTELETYYVVDEIDWHVPLGHSPFYPDLFVYKNISEWKRSKGE